MPYIQLRVPHIIIIFYQCKRSLILCAGYIFNGLYPMPDTVYFCQLAVITIVVVQNAMPVNFCSHGSGTPTEKADIISTMCDALHCPQCHLPRFWSRCFHPCIPSVCAGLLLHNAKMRADGTDFRQIFANKRIYFVTFLRLIAVPLMALVLLKLSHLADLSADGPTLILIVFLAIITPSASTVTQMCQVYGNDSRYASAINVVTTLASIVTMPLMVMLLQMVI